MAGKVTCYSVRRGRAFAADQKRLGLKVGGTFTTFQVVDDSRAWLIEAWGATPGERRTAALRAFEAQGNWSGPGAMAKVRERREAKP